ncbi:MAG: succinylglutamate desuccinylase/aspartoacylase family protein [Halobacteriales archaeon]|nr:succinylglutamate desuccinylase/aspartoacylase family protein [Halobacteriales archaeon]
MRVVELGEGEPEVAVVGAVHGDEPCGARAVERLIDDAPTVERPVKLIVANEEALAAGVRYLDDDLNRAFGEDVTAGSHEYELAPRLAAELEGCIGLSIHSTRSTDKPFAIANTRHDLAPRICPFLSVTAVVEITQDEGRIFAADADLIELESGLQGSDDAAENAYRIAREFLTAVGVLAGETMARELPRFELGEPHPEAAGRALPGARGELRAGGGRGGLRRGRRRPPRRRGALLPGAALGRRLRGYLRLPRQAHRPAARARGRDATVTDGGPQPARTSSSSRSR